MIASFSSQGNQSQELSQAEDKIEQLSQGVKQAKSDLKDSQDELADFKEENADYIEVGKKEVQKTKEIENSAGTAVKSLEKDQTQANLDLATSKVDAITDADKKEKFQKHIATVKTAIEAKKEKELEDKAETAVKNLENNQSRDNIDDAKNKVNAVNNQLKRKPSTTVSTLSFQLSKPKKPKLLNKLKNKPLLKLLLNRHSNNKTRQLPNQEIPQQFTLQELVATTTSIQIAVA